MTIALPARAKLNLDLRVTGTRPDGLHELRTHMQAIELHDLLVVERELTTNRSSVNFSGDMPVSSSGNTVTRAIEVLSEAVGRPLPTRAWLYKRIPPGSGMGGASSDAAAALRAAAAVHGLDVDLAPLAARIGADVAFFLKGGAALVEGAGERVTPHPVEHAWFAIAWPGVELSTALVYRAWDEVGGDGVNELRRAAGRVNSSIDKFAGALGEGWQMTGSGAAFFRRCADRKAAEAAAATVECWTTVTRAVGPWA